MPGNHPPAPGQAQAGQITAALRLVWISVIYGALVVAVALATASAVILAQSAAALATGSRPGTSNLALGESACRSTGATMVPSRQRRSYQGME